MLVLDKHREYLRKTLRESQSSLTFTNTDDVINLFFENMTTVKNIIKDILLDNATSIRLMHDFTGDKTCIFHNLHFAMDEYRKYWTSIISAIDALTTSSSIPMKNHGDFFARDHKFIDAIYGDSENPKITVPVVDAVSDLDIIPIIFQDIKMYYDYISNISKNLKVKKPVEHDVMLRLAATSASHYCIDMVLGITDLLETINDALWVQSSETDEAYNRKRYMMFPIIDESL